MDHSLQIFFPKGGARPRRPCQGIPVEGLGYLPFWSMADKNTLRRSTGRANPRTRLLGTYVHTSARCRSARRPHTDCESE
eukprot:1404519-Amphidinium_carterae.1